MSRSQKLLRDAWEYSHGSVGVYNNNQSLSPLGKYLESVIRPGTPLFRSVRLEMEGMIKLKGWIPFTATQVLNYDFGNIWAAQMKMGAIPVSGHDALTEHVAEMVWKAFGMFKVTKQEGPDVRRSDVGRMASELIWLPTVLTADVARASELVGDQTQFTVNLFGHPQTVSLALGQDHRPKTVQLMRWGTPVNRPFAQYPFGAHLSDWHEFQGISVPCHAEVGWEFGNPSLEEEGMFFKCDITSASFR